MAKRTEVKTKKPLLSNKSIVIMKLVAAGLLFFSCSLFFFQHLEMFIQDLTNLNPFIFIFFGGIIVVIVYGANLAGSIEEQKLYTSDRFDWIYKIVVTILVLATLMRRFLYNLSVPIAITVFIVLSCLLVLITPRIVDNNNDEF